MSEADGLDHLTLDGLLADLCDVISDYYEPNAPDRSVLDAKQDGIKKAIHELLRREEPREPHKKPNTLEALEKRVQALEAWVTQRSKPYHAPYTLVSAAREVLAEESPLHVSEVIRRIQSRGSYGARTYEQIRTALVPSLHRRTDVFRRVAPATYALVGATHTREGT